MKSIFKKNNKNTGFTLVEVIIACSIISLVTIALMSSASKGIELSGRALRQTQASMVLEEGVEAVKSIRDNSWTTISNLNLDTNYYLTFNTNTNTWSLGITAVTPVDSIFTRTVVFSAVNRDANDDIASSGTLDTGIKKVNVTVSWQTKTGTNSKNITFYLTNLFN